MDDCTRNGLAGNCGTEFCDALMDGHCTIPEECGYELLYEIGIEHLYPDVQPLDPNKEIEDAYDRAMGIL